MKLRKFEAPQRATKRGEAAITIDKKVGTIRISGQACDVIGLKAGDRIDLHQDVDEPTDWYLQVTPDGQLQTRPVKGSGALMVNSSALAESLCRSLKFTGRSCSIPVGQEPTDHKGTALWGLITGRLRENQ